MLSQSLRRLRHAMPGKERDSQRPTTAPVKGCSRDGRDIGSRQWRATFWGKSVTRRNNVLAAVAGWMQGYRQASKRQLAAVCPKQGENCQARSQPDSLMDRDVRLQLKVPRLEGWRSSVVDASAPRDQVVDRRRSS